VGPKPVISAKDTGQFPPEFEAKYEAFKKMDNDAANKAYKFFNDKDPKGKSFPPVGDLLTFVPEQLSDQMKIQKQIAELKTEAVKLGLANP
jgi:hypothetical protein